jgi:hypothetical protein
VNLIIGWMLLNVFLELMYAMRPDHELVLHISVLVGTYLVPDAQNAPFRMAMTGTSGDPIATPFALS